MFSQSKTCLVPSATVKLVGEVLTFKMSVNLKIRGRKIENNLNMIHRNWSWSESATEQTILANDFSDGAFMELFGENVSCDWKIWFTSFVVMFQISAE
jgi:hypothetical protein